MPESRGQEDVTSTACIAPRSDAVGPLAGLRVIELAGIGPGPYAAMLLADMGAEVIRVERPGRQPSNVPPEKDVLRRNRRSVVIDIRQPQGRDALLALVGTADVVLEGYRPGVAERLGVGPEDCWAVNERVVYGRMTGWGQSGPLASAAGHDIGYIAITGALGVVGRADGPPVPPANLVGDFGGGSLFLVVGVLAACWEASRSGRGQVVDAAIVDGASSLTALLHGMMASGLWSAERGTNMLDSGMPWYDTYETADGEWMAVGALEPQFFDSFVQLLGIEVSEGDRRDRARWPALRKRIADAFLTKPRADWAMIFEGTDACVAPVLSLAEAPDHPHLVARGTFIDVDGVVQPAPAPRFSRTTSSVRSAPPLVGEHTREVLSALPSVDLEKLLDAGVVRQAQRSASQSPTF